MTDHKLTSCKSLFMVYTFINPSPNIVFERIIDKTVRYRQCEGCTFDEAKLSEFDFHDVDSCIN